MGAKVDWGPMGPGKPFREESHSEWKAISNGWHGLVWAGPSDPFNNTLRAFLALNVDFDNLGGQGQKLFKMDPQNVDEFKRSWAEIA